MTKTNNFNNSLLSPNTRKEEETPGPIFKSASAKDLLAITDKDRMFEKYKIGHSIATGTYGEVRKCLHLASNKVRALKIINKSSISQTDIPKIARQLITLKEIDHPNIVKIYDIYQDSKRYFIVMEFCNSGDFFANLVKKDFISEIDAAQIVKQILLGLYFCSQYQIYHRSIKPKNILFTSNKLTEHLKLTDMGISNIFDPTCVIPSAPGSSLYKAPELIMNDFGEQCDIWSVGVLLYMLISGQTPFKGKTDVEIMESIKETKIELDGPNWINVTSDGKDLIKQMLTKDPRKRINSYNALNHKWIILHQDRNTILYKPMFIFSAARLRAIEVDTKLQQAATAFIISKLISDKDKEQLKSIFKEIDKNDDGQLSIDELFDGCKKIFGEQLSKSQIQEIFDKVDSDHSNTINYIEFLVATIDRNQALTDKNLRDAFDLLDNGKKGYLTVKEIKGLANPSNLISQEQWERILKEGDSNGDGVISLTEFIQLMRHFQ